MTKQVPEILRYINKDYLLGVYLLEDYFKEHPEKKPEGEIETSLWRGYFADYEIVNNELFIMDLKIIKNEEYHSVIHKVFPNEKKMKWFNGLILINFNQNTNTQELSFRLFEVKSGNISKIKDFNLEELIEFKSVQYEMFKLTDDYEIEKKTYSARIIENHYKYRNPKDRFPKISNEQFDSYLQEYLLEISKEILTD